MKNKESLSKGFRHSSIIFLIVLFFNIFSASAQNIGTMSSDSSSRQKHSMSNMTLPMPFFTHMGMPMPVGRYSLRFSTLLTQVNGTSYVDFGVQFETGLTNYIGFLARLDESKTEIMLNVAAIRSKNGMSGFSPLIEFEIATHESVNVQTGFSTTLSNSLIAFHQVIHYGLQEKNFEGSVALVYKVSKRIFLISEFLGEKKQDELLNATLLGGVKFQFNNHFLLAVGVQFPVTKNQDYTSQYILQPDLELGN